MPLETKRFDIHDYIKADQAQAGYLDAALEDGDPTLIAAAIGDIARARGRLNSRGKAGSAEKRSTRCSDLVETPSSRPSRKPSKSSAIV